MAWSTLAFWCFVVLSGFVCLLAHPYQGLLYVLVLCSVMIIKNLKGRDKGFFFFKLLFCAKFIVLLLFNRLSHILDLYKMFTSASKQSY